MKASYKRIRELEDIWERIIIRFGLSKFYTWLPELTVYFDDSPAAHKFYGEFCSEEGEVSINMSSHSTTRSAVKTMLHEYCHYLQHPGWYTRYEKQYNMELGLNEGYRNHPYEKAAWKFADEHIDEFVDYKR